MKYKQQQTRTVYAAHTQGNFLTRTWCPGIYFGPIGWVDLVADISKCRKCNCWRLIALRVRGSRGRVAVHFSSSRLSSASICGFAFLPLAPPAPYRYFEKPPYHWISAVACLSFLRHLCFLPSCVFVNVLVCVCVYSDLGRPGRLKHMDHKTAHMQPAKKKMMPAAWA